MKIPLPVKLKKTVYRCRCNKGFGSKHVSAFFSIQLYKPLEVRRTHYQWLPSANAVGVSRKLSKRKSAFGDNVKLTIDFDGFGRKVFMEKYTPLEKVR